jgi:hypothetical protein
MENILLKHIAITVAQHDRGEDRFAAPASRRPRHSSRPSPASWKHDHEPSKGSQALSMRELGDLQDWKSENA